MTVCQKLLQRHLTSSLWSQVVNQLNRQLLSQLSTQLLRGFFEHSLRPEELAWTCSQLDFCFSILNGDRHRGEWEVFQSLVKNCGWIFAWKNIAVVSNRTIKLSFDNQNRLHAEAEPAIQYADGYSLYSHHGVTLPEKYGMHPHNGKRNG